MLFSHWRSREWVCGGGGPPNSGWDQSWYMRKTDEKFFWGGKVIKMIDSKLDMRRRVTTFGHSVKIIVKVFNIIHQSIIHIIKIIA